MASHPLLRPSDRQDLVGVIDPDAYAAGTYTTGWVNAGLYNGFLAWIFAGDLGTNATVDAKIQQASSSSGTGAKDLTGAAITQLTQAGTDDNKQVAINFKTESLDTNNGFSWVRLSMTVGTATSDCGGALFGYDARFPVNHASTVDEVVG